LRQQSIATRSIRRTQRVQRPPLRSSSPEISALQIFIFRLDAFVGTELFGVEGQITVGRSGRAGLRLDGDTVSRLHCRLTIEGDRITVEDLGSGNGTLVNRERISGRRNVTSLDTITLGNFTLKVRALFAEQKGPVEAPAAEPTTRIEAILSSGGTEELPIDLEGQVDERLYADAVRRQSNIAQAASPGPTVRMKEQIQDDSTMMSPDEVSSSSTSGAAELDPEVEARLKDLDDLIASLDARQGRRQSSMVPWKSDTNSTADTTAREGKKKLSTKEFARDLASRLALDGELLPNAPKAAIKKERTADIIPLASRRPGTAKPTARAATTAFVLIPKSQLDGPETDLLDNALALPPTPMPVVLPRETFIEEPPHPRPAKRRGQEARLLTPSAMKVDVAPLKARGGVPEDSSLDDVWSSRAGEERPSSPPAPSSVAIKQTVAPVTRGQIRVEPVRPTPPAAKTNTKAPPAPPPAAKTNTKAPPPAARTQAKGQAPVQPPPLPQSPPPLPRPATAVRPTSRIDDFDRSAPAYDGIEISARAGGKVVDVSILKGPGDQYILGHSTPQGSIAPAKAHLGLRLVRINADRTVDLVFPRDVGGHLFRGSSTVMFSELTEGRKYSCLRLETQDIATIILGEGRQCVTYHLRFLKRAGSMLKALKRSGRSD
jgi:hypothetical protein